MILKYLRGKQRNETMFEVNFNMQIGHINTTNMFWEKILQFYQCVTVILYDHYFSNLVLRTGLLHKIWTHYSCGY